MNRAEQQQREWSEFEDQQLAQRRCPHSGGLLTRRDGYDGPRDPIGNDLACGVCDCFGYDLDDPRIVTTSIHSVPPKEEP